jgi:hypothetical protein
MHPCAYSGDSGPVLEVSWAEWLDRTFPESQGVRRLEGAKVFFSEEITGSSHQKRAPYGAFLFRCDHGGDSEPYISEVHDGKSDRKERDSERH